MGTLPRRLYSKVPSWAVWVCEIGRTLFFLRACSCWGRCVVVSGSPGAGWLPGASKECSLVCQACDSIPGACQTSTLEAPAYIPTTVYNLRARPRPSCLSLSPASAMGWSVRAGSAGPQLLLPQLNAVCLGPGGHYLKPPPSHRIDLTHILPFRRRLRDMRGNGECITSRREFYGCGVLDSFMLTLI